MSDEKTQDADISMHLLDEDEENVPIKKKSILLSYSINRGQNFNNQRKK